MQVESVNVVEALPALVIKPPKVSVCVVTFNQEKYIAQCLQSIVDQETDFDFEIIVGDDCSTDGTREIVRAFAKKYPEKFRLIFQPQNIGAAFNYSMTHQLAIGEYVAHMDGDDLMLPRKLQKQVNAFAENPSCVMISHDMLITNGDNSINKRTFNKHKAGISTIWDLYKTLPFFAHSSKMARKDVDLKVLQIIEKNTLDIELHIAMAENGDIFHIDEPLGSYRTGTGTSVAVKKFVNPILIEGSERVFEAAIRKYPEQMINLKKNYAKVILSYAYQAALLRNKGQVRKLSRQSIGICFYSIIQLSFIALPLNVAFVLVSIRKAIRYSS